MSICPFSLRITSCTEASKVQDRVVCDVLGEDGGVSLWQEMLLHSYRGGSQEGMGERVGGEDGRDGKGEEIEGNQPRDGEEGAGRQAQQ